MKWILLIGSFLLIGFALFLWVTSSTGRHDFTLGALLSANAAVTMFCTFLVLNRFSAR